jgi:SSS family solute:Na+ symporter
MLGIFLLGALTRRTTPRGALVGALAGLATLGIVALETHVAWTWYVAIGTCTTFAIGRVISEFQ